MFRVVIKALLVSPTVGAVTCMCKGLSVVLCRSSDSLSPPEAMFGFTGKDRMPLVDNQFY